MTSGAVTVDGCARVLADGSQMPMPGLGVWQLPNGPECVNAVRWALPGSVAAAVLEFCEAALAVNPPACRQAAVRPAGWLSRRPARHLRVVSRIDEASRIVHVLDVDHRSGIYHQPKA